MTAPTIRASMLPSYAACMRRTVGRIVLTPPDRPQKERIATVLGTVAHNVLRVYIENGGDIDIPAEVDSQTDIELGNMKYPLEWDNYTKTRTEMRRQIITIINQVEESGAKNMIAGGIEYCEQKFTAPLHELLDTNLSSKWQYKDSGILVTGTLDILTHRGTVVDWKTGMHLQCYPPQLALYGMLAELHGAKVHTLLHYWIKRSNFALKQFIYDYQEAKAITKTILHSIAENVMMTAADPNKILEIIPDPSCNLCSAKFCELHSTPHCSYGKQPKEE